MGKWMAIFMLVGATTVYAGDIEVEGEQYQKQDQKQDQQQQQGQIQEVVAISESGAVAESNQSQDQGNSQSTSIVENTESQRRSLVQSSPVLVVGQAQEGLSLGMPWGNASLAKQGEVSKIVGCGSFLTEYGDSADPRLQELSDRCMKAATRCGVLCKVSRLLF